MRKWAFILLGILIVGAIGTGWILPVQASPAYQYTPFPTPTPGEDGRILYKVQEGDNPYRIAGVAGITLDEFYRLNNFEADPVLQIGQEVLIGLIQPPTADPNATLDPAQLALITPSPTLLQDSSTICVLLYLDGNGDALRQPEEIPLADGEVSVTEREGAFSDKGTTAWEDAICFEGIPPGEYIITMALPGGFNRTTGLTTTIELAPGDTSYLNFGAQPSSAFVIDPDQPSTGTQRSPLLAVLGITLLLVGVGVAVYIGFRGRRRFPRQEE